ncbi:MAG: hypothetical protein IKC24_07135 [Oscillospiraceae bacterium]|nr:hypothetical protein [Oscillospiraceae bacterium]
MAKYQSYRGRVPLKRKLAVAAMVLILLICGAYLAISQYVEFESDGGMSLRLPWVSEETRQEKEDGSGELPDISLVINEPQDLLDEMHAVEISAQTLRLRRDEGQWWTAEGFNAVSVRLKEKDGMLHYAFASAPAELIHPGALSRAELEVLLNDDVYTVARISCFSDSAAAAMDMAGKGLCQKNGYIWYDNSNNHWLDPGKEAAQDYLVALCAELVELGFDEVLLENACYPTMGKLHKSAPVQVDRSKTIEKFLGAVAKVFDGEHVRLSLVLDERTLLAGSDETAGLELKEVLGDVLRLYVRTADPAAAETALRGCAETTKLVVIDGTEGARCTVR